eukprot:7296559-Prymnesium_polylepis.1
MPGGDRPAAAGRTPEPYILCRHGQGLLQVLRRPPAQRVRRGQRAAGRRHANRVCPDRETSAHRSAEERLKVLAAQEATVSVISHVAFSSPARWEEEKGRGYWPLHVLCANPH